MTIDHVVLAAPDLAATVARLERLTGVRPVAGGRHPDAGTRNFLLGIGEASYLEIIGRDTGQPAPATRLPFDLDSRTEPAVVTWALRVDRIDERVATALAQGFDTGDVVSGSRVAPDGRVFEGRITPPATGTDTGLLPFLIEWGGSCHPAATLPKVPLVSLTAVHPDPGRIRKGLRALRATIEVRSGDRPALVVCLQGHGGPVVLR